MCFTRCDNCYVLLKAMYWGKIRHCIKNFVSVNKWRWNNLIFCFFLSRLYFCQKYEMEYFMLPSNTKNIPIENRIEMNFRYTPIDSRCTHFWQAKKILFFIEGSVCMLYLLLERAVKVQGALKFQSFLLNMPCQ